jgi:hypothetical protein
MSLLEIHVALSLIGIVSGLVVLYGLLSGKALGGWTASFLATTILTSVTGFPLSPSRSALIICFISPARGAGSMS